MKKRQIPTIDPNDLPTRITMPDGFVLYVHNWLHVDGIEIPVFVYGNLCANAIQFEVHIDHLNLTISVIGIASSLKRMLTNEELNAVLQHEVRHYRRHFWLAPMLHLLLGKTAKFAEKGDRSLPRLCVAAAMEAALAPAFWLMELDADNVPKEHRVHLASALHKMHERMNLTRLMATTGACVTHPPLALRKLILK